MLILLMRHNQGNAGVQPDPCCGLYAVEGGRAKRLLPFDFSTDNAPRG